MDVFFPYEVFFPPITCFFHSGSSIVELDGRPIPREEALSGSGSIFTKI